LSIFLQTHPVTLVFADDKRTSSASNLPNQCVQIEQVFALSSIVYFGHLFQNYGSSSNFWDYLFPRKKYVLILEKMGWAIFGVIILQTHLVTLCQNLGTEPQYCAKFQCRITSFGLSVFLRLNVELKVIHHKPNSLNKN
jgi:hypothetical protein